MDFFKKILPLSFKFNKDLKTFIITLVIYVVGLALVNPILGILGILTLGLGWLIALVCDIYALAGIVFAILVFAKVIKLDAADEVVEVEAAEEAAEEAVAETADAE